MIYDPQNVRRVYTSKKHAAEAKWFSIIKLTSPSLGRKQDVLSYFRGKNKYFSVYIIFNSQGLTVAICNIYGRVAS
jgi:hypothetical protein